jgi:exonuclease III
MGGDFNGHSHLDWTEQVKNMYNHGGAIVEWPVSKAIIDAGFKDSFREIHPDPAVNIGTSWLGPVSSDLPERADRIDYIYYRGKGIKVIDSDVFNAPLGGNFTFNGKDFLYASDHGFVLSTFKIE